MRSNHFHSFSHFISFLFFLEAVKNQKENPPAFIPQTPFCGRENLDSVLRKSISPENSFRKTESELKPRHTARISLWAEPQRKMSFPF
ncbi:MAG: hypothetical protein A2W51_00815 [Candidatus Zambryskibacteria bacterium RIFCSPHIGHO2_02_39_10]|nr:MAG: hypothetical protein A2W51_00815 [Candidatus Zambryskibacteria bacterium RIFCSPHIGHO2_02_39_10]